MWQLAIKVALTASVIVAVSEIARRSTLWGAVLASLPLFLILPFLLRTGWPFWPSLGAACGITVGAYFALVWILGRFHVQL